jgi:hypothetical protein
MGSATDDETSGEEDLTWPPWFPLSAKAEIEELYVPFNINAITFDKRSYISKIDASLARRSYTTSLFDDQEQEESQRMDTRAKTIYETVVAGIDPLIDTIKTLLTDKEYLKLAANPRHRITMENITEHCGPLDDRLMNRVFMTLRYSWDPELTYLKLDLLRQEGLLEEAFVDAFINDLPLQELYNKFYILYSNAISTWDDTNEDPFIEISPILQQVVHRWSTLSGIEEDRVAQLFQSLFVDTTTDKQSATYRDRFDHEAINYLITISPKYFWWQRETDFPKHTTSPDRFPLLFTEYAVGALMSNHETAMAGVGLYKIVEQIYSEHFGWYNFHPDVKKLAYSPYLSYEDIQSEKNTSNGTFQDNHLIAYTGKSSDKKGADFLEEEVTFYESVSASRKLSDISALSHEYAHGIFEKLCGKVANSSETAYDISVFTTLNEGFATFMEFLTLQIIIQDPELLGFTQEDIPNLIKIKRARAHMLKEAAPIYIEGFILFWAIYLEGAMPDDTDKLDMEKGLVHVKDFVANIDIARTSSTLLESPFFAKISLLIRDHSTRRKGIDTLRTFVEKTTP